MVIVTRRCFLTCEKIVSMTIQEDIPEYNLVRKAFNLDKTKSKTKRKVSKLKKPLVDLRRFTVVIHFVPLANSQPPPPSSSYGKSNDDHFDEVTIVILGELSALDFFKEVVAQIREQNPDQMFLDSLFDKIFGDKPGVRLLGV